MKLVSSRIVGRVTLVVLAIVVAIGTIGVTDSRTAYAAINDATLHHIINGSWYLHPGNPTDSPSFSGPISDLMPQGAEFDIQCVTTGPAITPDGNLATDGNGDTAWEYGTFTQASDMGFVSDQGLDTQVTQGQEISQLNAQGIPTCGNNSSTSGTESVSNDLQPASSLQGNQAVPQQTNIYNRQGAVNWALANAMDQPPTDGSCAWFVSNALWQGGLVKTSAWTNTGIYGINPFSSGYGQLSGTYDAWNVLGLLNYLEATYPASVEEPIDFSPSNIEPPDAQIGDLVFYDWGNGEGTSHVAIVTGIDPSGYLEVSDWSTNDDGTLPSPVPQRGVTYSAVHNEWLQVRYPHVSAFLLHIDTAGTVSNP
jgi:hypothetical protein